MVNLYLFIVLSLEMWAAQRRESKSSDEKGNSTPLRFRDRISERGDVWLVVVVESRHPTYLTKNTSTQGRIYINF